MHHRIDVVEFLFQGVTMFLKNSIRKIPLRPSSLVIGIGAISGLALTGIYVTKPSLILESKSYRNSLQLWNGLIRLNSLISTVTIICYDYLTIMNENKDVIRKSDPIREEIRLLRLEHERLGVELYLQKKIEDHDRLKQEIQVVVQKLKDLSIQLAAAIEEDPPSPYIEAHERSAIRLHKLCERNGGVYIKLGQHLAQLDYILPIEFVVPLRQLLGDTPRSSKEAVRRTIFEDLGRYPEEIWTKFEWEPIASASLAQVHVAYDSNGTKYAIKVQHETLRETSVSDMQAVTFVVDLVAELYKDFSYKWLAREMNTNLPLELDFTKEARNIEKCRKLLQPMIQSGELALPQVYHCTPRVLVMSFEEGCYLTNTKKIQEMQVNPAEVARLISKTFCEQIYRHGFVHCDPHTANVLVRVRPTDTSLLSLSSWWNYFFSSTPRAQIVLLDHGLYQQLDDKFRRDYCRLWRALVTGSKDDIEKYCREMNAGDLYPLLSAMLTLRPWDDIISNDNINRLQNKGTKTESERMRYYAQRYVTQINELLEHIPSSLLLLLKTNDCLRQLDKSVGRPVNTLTVVLETTSEVIFDEEYHNSQTIQDKFAVWMEYLSLQSRALGLDLFSKWIR